MRVEIHHLRSGTDAERARLGREHDAPWSERGGWYRHVATLDIELTDEVEDVIDHAYALAQHSPGDVWPERAEVAWVLDGELRSTYVGDVLVAGESGPVYEVAFLGWRRIDVLEMPPRSRLDPERIAAEARSGR